MKQNGTKRLTISYLALTAALLALFMLNIFCGSTALSPKDILSTLFSAENNALAQKIIFGLRLPRAAMVVLLGAALSVAGYLLQTFFANPIAGPFVMGVSGGAKLAVALTMVVLLNHGLFTSSLTLILASFVGAMVAMGFVLAVSQRVKRAGVLVICGVMISYICSAVTDFIVTFADDANIVNLHNWSQGSFSGISWENVAVMAVVVLITSLGVFLLSKQISAYEMGEAYAKNMGLNVPVFRMMLVLLSSILSASVTAFAVLR